MVLYREPINKEFSIPPRGKGCLRVKPTQKVQNSQRKMKIERKTESEG